MGRKLTRKPGGAPTIADVARRAGVSPMTVSRVINGETNVRDATRETVNAAIAALRYAPNPAARSLAGADQIRVGLLYSNPSAAYLSEFLVGSLEQASRADVQLVIEKCDVGLQEAQAARHLVASGIDGVILPPPLCDASDVIAVLAAAGVPVVAVASGSPAATVHAVGIDDHAAAQAMARHLIELGHRRIGFVIGNPNQTASGRRLAGFRAALAAAGVAIDPALIRQGLFTYRSGLAAAEALLDLPDPPSAIFASNDDMAAAAVAVAHRRGLDVPRQLSVCGFDDTALATTIWPELTTVRQPIAEMSREAVDMLVREVRARRTRKAEEPRHLLLDHALIRRQSDAPPPPGSA